MADNGGLKAAFHAYRGWLESNSELPPLPGVNLTHEQLFYVGFAQKHLRRLICKYSLMLILLRNTGKTVIRTKQ
ncbi:endothelin-converting enzyme 2-like [Tropilaelaps mercedesae]|uniref:Endothelin-converting enzyme 2-like n=1 Tax=Tropilaelaps mercedesae TaxID=418985 RepID=A0A1V9Y0H5_9ACAR|nr:endothelin-converting enzyme 2-like [Tropilaelaps mercedesae]